jgi:hypothetical protein
LKGVAELQALVKQRTWDKEVVLWLGSEQTLTSALGSTQHAVLDLLDLFLPENMPPDDDATKDVLRDQLRQYLRSIQSGSDSRTVLVVKSVGLLVRYNVGLKEFYDWFVSSHTILVLLLEEVPEKSDWPEDVRCESRKLLDYFSEPGMVKETYTTKG